MKLFINLLILISILCTLYYISIPNNEEFIATDDPMKMYVSPDKYDNESNLDLKPEVKLFNNIPNPETLKLPTLSEEKKNVEPDIGLGTKQNTVSTNNEYNIKINLDDYIKKKDIRKHIDAREYVHRNNLPKLPNMGNYILKTNLPTIPNMDNYIHKNQMPVCDKVPDMANFMLKSQIPSCNTCNYDGYVKKTSVKPCPQLPDMKKFVLKTSVPPPTVCPNPCNTVRKIITCKKQPLVCMPRNKAFKDVPKTCPPPPKNVEKNMIKKLDNKISKVTEQNRQLLKKSNKIIIPKSNNQNLIKELRNIRKDIGKKPRTDIEKKPRKDIGKKNRTDIEKKPRKDIEKKPRKDIGKKNRDIIQKKNLINNDKYDFIISDIMSLKKNKLDVIRSNA